MGRLIGRAPLAWSWLVLIGVMPAIGAAQNIGRAEVRRDGDHVTMTWPAGPVEIGSLTFDLAKDQPLFESLALVETANGRSTSLASDVDPVTFLVVGSRENPPPTPPGMSVFNVFFDNPLKRTHHTYASMFERKDLRILSQGSRTSIAIGPLEFVAIDGVHLSPFRGEVVVTVYAGSPLVQVEAVIKTDQERVAYTFETGLIGRATTGNRLAWIDTEGKLRRLDASRTADRAEAVRHRLIVAEGDGGQGSLACFPPPHQFFFPRDWTDNLKTVWHGVGHQNQAISLGFGFGIRQPETGGGNYVPWFNAPPGTEQRLGVFYLLSRGSAETAIAEVLKFTHGDRFPAIPGYKTFSSHWHMAFTVDAMQKQARHVDPLPVPDLVGIFKGLGVDAVHVAEFHGDGHPDDPGPLRLPELAAMFDECKRLSDDQLLLIPGEEANLYLGPRKPGRNPGHWLEMFPKPVYFTMKRAKGQPFVETVPRFGQVYHVGDSSDMFELLKREHGLAWTAHARIKASNFAPDIYRDEDFFVDDVWLGAAWKAMPADLSREKLGERTLNLLDDMANWGRKKLLLGEVDVFKIDHTHEVYGHMNVNYVKLDKLPAFDDGWQPLSDALRTGRFFVTTGEILIPDATIGGKSFGDVLTLGPDNNSPEIKLNFSWTFPLRFAEVISGDGANVNRERIDLTDTPAFGQKTITFQPNLAGRKWARLEVWDIAGNGAFTQPVWINK